MVHHTLRVILVLRCFRQREKDTLSLKANTFYVFSLAIVYLRHQIHILKVDFVIHQETQLFEFVCDNRHFQRFHTLDD